MGFLRNVLLSFADNAQKEEKIWAFASLEGNIWAICSMAWRTNPPDSLLCGAQSPGVC
jgi:hypothetical protein